ncbi:RICIN domain-containing protein [Microbulbifer rhizosphaerae]|uniref:Lysophospholipase L1-like esterase n=1 Tax=Microbulbifer rhizosphaerae TaxID=1562603 RepID=A0A7W4WFX2_9GAMM|nr:RICIN domain-containing protein [Microbulbifer rhizosphaerae]MBB3063466.1 lysophospholipase L1-like esterase [Microbulbifer rhizosphaerae]
MNTTKIPGNRTWFVGLAFLTLFAASNTRAENCDAPPTSGEAYKLINRGSGYALDVAGRSTEDGANVLQWSEHDDTNQQFLATDLGNGYWSLLAVHSGDSLEVADSSSSDGANVQQMGYSGESNQQWQFKKSSGGGFAVVARHSGNPITAESSSLGANVSQTTLSGDSLQRWYFNPVNGNCGGAIGEAPTIHMLGDSTMTEYDESRRPQMGWGEAMPMFFSEESVINNWAKGGRSSRSFYYETTRWPAILPTIEEGDYVIIQFGHNDQKNGGNYLEYGTYAFCSDGNGDGENCADVEHSYYQFLKRYVLETREKGAKPILMTPIVRKYFSGDSITERGQHNLQSSYSGENYPRGDYPAAMKAVAQAYDVPLVDLTAETKAIVESYGDEAATEHLYIAADSTHPQVLFATLIAKAAVETLDTYGLMQGHIVEASSLVASPGELDWGNRFVDVPNTKKLTISAFDLVPETGAVDVTAPDGFLLSDSADSEVWSSSTTIDFTNGAFTTNLYVQFTAASEQPYTGEVSFALEGAKLGSVAVSGTGVAAGEGVASYSSWFTEGSSVTPISDGLVSAGDALASNLVAGNTKTLAVDGQDTSVARYRVEGPEMVARSDDRYLQFSVTAESQTFYVDTISAYLTSSGGSTVQADIEYSLSSDFSNPVKLNSEALSFTSDTMTLKEYGVTVPVSAGDTLYVRIFPWNSAGNTGKYLAIYDARITGISGE